MHSKGSILAVLLSAQAFLVLTDQDKLTVLAPDAKHKHGHHHHGHHHHHKKGAVSNGTNATVKTKANQPVVNGAAPTKLMMKMKKLENAIAATAKHETQLRKGELEMNGPLPANFAEEFATEVAKATGCKKEDVKVLNTTQLKDQKGVDEVVFEAPPECVKEIEEQAADPDSKLAKGPLRIFLIEKDGDDDQAETADLKEKDAAKLTKDGDEDADVEAEAPKGLKPEDSEDKESDDSKDDKKDKKDKKRKKEKKEKKGAKDSEDDVEDEEKAKEEDDEEETPVQEKGIDIDTSMPYGELEPFGREDTAQELTKGSIRQSDEMVDQLERAEVAEEKRAVFRALTRLRGAAITSFDGVARSQTGNIDAYARTNHWRSTHPVRHLADEESDIGKWAFPENSDF